MLQQIRKSTEFYLPQVADERWSWIINPMQHRTSNRTSMESSQQVRNTYLALVCFVLFVCSSLNVNPVLADTEDASDFQACVQTLRTEAANQALPPDAINSVFASAKRLARVVAADRKQAEFIQSFGTYYGNRVTTTRIEKGREYLAEHAKLLNTVRATTGVPPQYLVALWGLETNFGQYFGKLSIPSALATLACDKRRAQFFKEQLFALVTLVGEGHMTVDQLRGSWAGAMGHMQFMPTTYLAHAVDADGDGRKDVYASLADALTSGGNYLQSAGWESGYRWGREVLLPENFDYAETGFHNWAPLSHWASLGITDTFGKDLPVIDYQAAILLPSGHTGPAFAVYPNFKVIMKWNRSTHYALSVGRLADRISGAGRLARDLPTASQLSISPDQLKKIQSGLNELGIDAGSVDGILGSGTQRAIQQFERQSGLIADGFPDAQVLGALLNP